MRLRTVVAVVYSAGSSVAVPYPDVVLASQEGMDLRLGFHQGIHRSRDSWAVGGIAVAAAVVAAIALDLVVGSAAVLAAAHIAVSPAVVHSDAVYWHLRLAEGDSVAAGAREEMRAAVGRIGRREGAQSIVVVVVVGREVEGSSSHQAAGLVGVLT
jgi:hypothetical protein